jgi:hypothetical protein
VKAKGKLVSALLVIDTFFISFALGFNSRSVLVVDPSLPPVKPALKQEPAVAPVAATSKTPADAPSKAPAKSPNKAAAKATKKKLAKVGHKKPVQALPVKPAE